MVRGLNVSSALLAYENLITLNDEVELVWKRKKTIASWLFLASTTTATPIGPPWISHQLAKRHDNVVTLDNGTMVVVDPETSQPLAQELASDGSGNDFDAAAIIWLAWSFAVGVPLALGGIKLWRLTTGASLGIAAAVLGMFVPSPASRNMNFLLVLYDVC